ncbi:alpha/beta hydrolase family protein [Burkholderia plantarii]|uniref:Putative alpha/beta hydrolase n=1 Tax=Burkholderia plantarii TaxID=41899 RepID=A0A0B6RUU2_BURPL|nr:alpha/beta fold hydrolase [Burkholderia plantarii]AJK47173.1 putative alpha/beta hydrolase [Burkholderia plantarii]ALK31383.1 alpha/beta fold family hydrolase [Burkholderia plantarii]GLZ22663.1 hypothetical protein Bpla01_61920 [Burkholderia plantarii]
MTSAPTPSLPPEPFTAPAADGFALNGFAWRHRAPDPNRAVVVIQCATAVRCRYYFRFAAWLFAQGFDALVYDYRGIGESRPASLRALRANWLDWGRLDSEAVLQYAARAFPGQPVDVVAHSVGGFAFGLAASNARVRRAVMVGSQTAHWRDYAPWARRRMFWKWHVAMPLLAHLLGYLPARRLGWMEDVPKGVALSWSRSRPRFEDTYRRAPIAETPDERRAMVARFANLTAPLLAISVSDDPFGTIAATERLLGYYVHSPVTHLRIAPERIGVSEIGHFAFFHSRFESALWPLVPGWLREAALPADAPGEILRRPAPAAEAPLSSDAIR